MAWPKGVSRKVTMDKELHSGDELSGVLGELVSDLEKPKEKTPSLEGVKRYGVRTEFISDKFSKITSLVEKNDGVCEFCRMDACRDYGLPPWNELEPQAKEKIRAAMIRHKEQNHQGESAILIDLDEVPKGWINGQPWWPPAEAAAREEKRKAALAAAK